MTPQENAAHMMQKAMELTDFESAKKITLFFVDEILQSIWGYGEESVQDYWNETYQTLQKMTSI